MIPHILHYVWLGGRPLNPIGQRCFASWQRLLPDWEIRRWDETNSPVEHPFVKKMLAEKKYAFASDFIRLFALAEEGGLYLDTDMELIGDVRPILNHSCVLVFLSAQNRPSKNSASMGFLASVPRHPWIIELRDRYQNLDRAVMNTTLATESLKKRGLAGLRDASQHQKYWDLGDLRIYHSDLFYPYLERMPVHAPLGIHHAEGSWEGQADPLPWWRQLYDLRLDRRILRPLERIVKSLRP